MPAKASRAQQVERRQVRGLLLFAAMVLLICGWRAASLGLFRAGWWHF